MVLKSPGIMRKVSLEEMTVSQELKSSGNKREFGINGNVYKTRNILLSVSNVIHKASQYKYL